MGSIVESGDISNSEMKTDNDSVASICTNAGNFAYHILPQKEDDPYTQSSVPCHVLLNLVGTVCKRYNHCLKGTNYQKNFIQRLVASMCGTSFPVIYPPAMCFPRHYYVQAT